jgi:hypothetical protein
MFSRSYLMRCVVSVVAVSFVFWGVSCVEKNPPPDRPVTILSAPKSSQPPPAPQQQRVAGAREQQPQQQPPRPAAQPRPSRAESRQTAAVTGTPEIPAGAPAPPQGAQYTIFCARVEGDAHVERANRIKSELINKSGLSGFYVVHEAGQSLLYYGFYRTFNDPADRKESSRAQADLKRVKELNADGNALFAGAIFVNLEAPDPVAPPEWSLVRAHGVWSLQIAAYKDSPLRKEYAVASVREARAQGIEAYYYHGETVSSVCIGVWPEQAVKVHDPSRQVQPNERFIITSPGMPEPAGLTRAKDVKVVQEQVQIIDPSLLDTMRRYPDHAVNGEQTVRIVNGKQIGDPSLLIRIPPAKPGNSVLSDTTHGVPPGGALPPAAYQPRVPPPAPATGAPPGGASQPQPGSGRLKSIDD